ncbi:methyl-accepting chemotaxis protein [Glaciecola sp. 1036]|uniref:methyl-accepting chemotaxis protein n=1 Tax=Alteromonadaceae TaxID=72275 RepID=UPI003D00B1E1
MTLFNKFKFNLSNEESQRDDAKKAQADLTQLRRISQALALSSTAVMISDNDLNIIYTNDSVVDLLKDHEREIQKELPHFEANNLVGKNIDIFHKNPAHQRRMLADMNSKSVSSITVGELNLKLTLVPLFDEQNTRIGFMVEWLEQTDILKKTAMLDALDRSQAVIEFSPKGIIRAANKNFLDTLGYKESEIVGKHHQIFMPQEERNTSAYREFWENLAKGKFAAGDFKRIDKDGREVWINASYNPVMNESGQVMAVVKYASNITEQKVKAADYEGQIEAISKSQAVIEFDLDGTILTANQAFQDTMGYSLDEIQGKHHSMFAEKEFARSPEYAAFWENLGAGNFFSDEYKRVAKGGREVWLQASYNPILDMNGRPVKVVKYATDITERKVAVAEIKRVLMNLSDGDLTTGIDQDFGPEFAELKDAINNFITGIHKTVSTINSAASTISIAASEIAKGNSDLSARTEEQASSLEETASTMEELTSTVRQNSDHAGQASTLATDATDIAISGGDLISQVVTTMSSINESAQKISDIIGVIDGIAFQTNILALNAAVEAARAGEQGRGFAVVASEVRSLAQRSANAAKDIKTLISDSVGKIENGNSLVGQSGETMEKIVESIKHVSQIMSEIDAASKEQSTSIDEVSKSVIQMDTVTQQNAALVEEAAAASENMQNQAVELSKMVSSFKI